MSEAPAPSSRHGISPWQFGLLLGILIFAEYPQVLLGLETFVARDFGFFGYPLAYFQRECFWHRELPFWDPYNNCGVPFLAQWNTMPLYPPSLIYLLLPLNWSLSFFSLLHLWFAGLGMFFLARRWTGNSYAAAFAGAAFSFNGFTLNLLMWPSHIATFSWMPWVVLAVESSWREGGKKLPLAAAVGAMQMLAGGPETIFLTWAIISALWLQQLITAEMPLVKMLCRYALVMVLVFALSAIQLLPFLDLVAHAQRETGYTDLRWSMPATGLANFLVPMAFGSTATEGIFFQHGQYWTSSYYVGIGVLWLAIMAAICVGDRRARLLGFLAVVALFCALGDHTPFYPAVRKLIPQLSFITYPVKFVMVTIFAAPLLAAFALANFENCRKWFFPTGGALLLLIAGIICWTEHAVSTGDNPQAALFNGISRGVFVLGTGAVLYLLTNNLDSRLLRFAIFLLVIVGWLDIFTHEPRQNPTVPTSVFEPNVVRTQLAMKPQPELGGSRAMLSPTAALGLTTFAVSDPKTNFLAKRIGYCADVNLLDAVPKVDGFFSLAPREFDNLLSLIYSATNGNWSGLEDFMGVSQYSSPANFFTWQARGSYLPLVTGGQQPIFLDDTNTLWTFGRNEFDPAKTVFLAPTERPNLNVSNTVLAITAVKFRNSTVDFHVEAAAPALAMVAQTYYHNWRARVDGNVAPVLRANVAFQAVPVPAGRHQVHIYYEDRAFEIGAAISICMWVNCIVSYLALRRRELPASPAPKNGDYF